MALVGQEPAFADRSPGMAGTVDGNQLRGSLPIERDRQYSGTSNDKSKGKP